jgi:hypothetical protein
MNYLSDEETLFVWRQLGRWVDDGLIQEENRDMCCAKLVRTYCHVRKIGIVISLEDYCRDCYAAMTAVAAIPRQPSARRMTVH